MTSDEANSTREAAWSWDGKGWFGGQIGSTIAMLIGGVFIIRRDPVSGVILLAGWLVLNALGLFLWSRRLRWRRYPATQTYLAAFSIVVAIVVLTVKSLGGGYAKTGMVSTPVLYWQLAMGPLLMVMLSLIRRDNPRRSESDTAPQEGRRPDRG